MPEEFWLRVHDDGRDGRYDHDPATIRALRVVIIDGFEETWTADRVSRTGWGGPNPPQRLGGDEWHRRQHIMAAKSRRKRLAIAVNLPTPRPRVNAASTAPSSHAAPSAPGVHPLSQYD